MKAAGTKAVALLQLPGAVVTTSFQDDYAAVGAMFLAGQATGDAWADVLFGGVNPVGRLPVTFPIVGDSTDTVQPCLDLECTCICMSASMQNMREANCATTQHDTREELDVGWAWT